MKKQFLAVLVTIALLATLVVSNMGLIPTKATDITDEWKEMSIQILVTDSNGNDINSNAANNWNALDNGYFYFLVNFRPGEACTNGGTLVNTHIEVDSYEGSTPLDVIGFDYKRELSGGWTGNAKNDYVYNAHQFTASSSLYATYFRLSASEPVTFGFKCVIESADGTNTKESSYRYIRFEGGYAMFTRNESNIHNIPIPSTEESTVEPTTEETSVETSTEESTVESTSVEPTEESSSVEPTAESTSVEPTVAPSTEAPSTEPSTEPSTKPTTKATTVVPTSTVAPTTTVEPTAEPTVIPTTTVEPTAEPTTEETTEETTTRQPFTMPTMPTGFTMPTIPTTTAKTTTTAHIITTNSEGVVTSQSDVKAPGKAVIKKVAKKKRSAKKLKVTLKATVGAKGYQISVYKNKKHAKKHIKALVTKYTTKLKYTIKSKKLAKKKKLFVGARAYVLKLDGTKLFGAWSKTKKVKIK